MEISGLEIIDNVISDNTGSGVVVEGLTSGGGSSEGQFNQSTKRQTVLSGPTNGANEADFIKDAGGLNATIKGAAENIIISFANGFNASGAVDYIGKIDSDINISLTNNTTNYIFAKRTASGTVDVEVLSNLVLDDVGQSWGKIKPYPSLILSTITTVSNDLHAIDYNGNYYVAVGAGGRIWSSSDGSNYTNVFTVGASTFYDVVWSDQLSLWVAVGSGGIIYTSSDSDGSSWTSRTSGTANDLNGITWNNFVSLFVIVGNSGTVLTSPDGTTWTSRTSGTANNLNDVVSYYDTDLFTKYIACGNTGTIIVSDNGTSWSTVTSGTSENLFGVTNNKLDNSFSGSDQTTGIVVGANGIILRTINFFDYEIVESNVATDLNAVSFDRSTNEKFFTAVGNANVAIYSVDGSYWERIPTVGTTTDLNGLFATQLNRFIAVGDVAGAPVHIHDANISYRWFNQNKQKMYEYVFVSGGYIETNQVALGQVTTSGGSITEIRTYAINRMWRKGWTSVSASTNYTWYHNLGIKLNEINAFPKFYFSLDGRGEDSSFAHDIFFADGNVPYGHYMEENVASNTRNSVKFGFQTNVQVYRDVSRTTGYYDCFIDA